MIRLDARATGVYRISVTPFTDRGLIASAALRKPGPTLSAADIADLARRVRRQTRRLARIG
ncbi:MAG: hypothetical protein JNL87_21250 [Burkholderiaceae bacterium]|nr:hypothetical protein [Burkholderiaceae bacterium]